MSENTQQTTLSKLGNSQTNQVAIGFDSSQGYELLIKVAKSFALSTFVPEQYRGEQGYNNCIIAVDMAFRLKAAPLMVMQNLYIVHGRPAWSTQWIIAMVNNCGRFSPLQYEVKDLGKKEIEYTETYWENKQKLSRKVKVTIHDKSCVAYATELRTGEKVYGVEVSISMAVSEGWYGKDGSKWKTMPDVMLRYRAASFFGKLYAPELLMGLQTAEEAYDIIDMDSNGNITNITPANEQTSTNIRRQRKDVTPKNQEPSEHPNNIVDGVDQETGEVMDDELQVDPAIQAAAQAKFNI